MSNILKQREYIISIFFLDFYIYKTNGCAASWTWPAAACMEIRSYSTWHSAPIHPSSIYRRIQFSASLTLYMHICLGHVSRLVQVGVRTWRGVRTVLVGGCMNLTSLPARECTPSVKKKVNCGFRTNVWSSVLFKKIMKKIKKLSHA